MVITRRIKNSVCDNLFLSIVDASELYEVINNFKNKRTRDTNILHSLALLQVLSINSFRKEVEGNRQY